MEGQSTLVQRKGATVEVNEEDWESREERRRKEVVLVLVLVAVVAKEDSVGSSYSRVATETCKP